VATDFPAVSLPDTEENPMKKIGFVIVMIVAAIVFSIAFPAVAAGPKAPAPPVAAVPVLAVAAAALPAEPHPHIREALESMREAKKHLETAAHDFDGHRVKSLEHLQKAIEEAEICMKLDNK
jgi:hypothetical protein